MINDVGGLCYNMVKYMVDIYGVVVLVLWMFCLFVD